MGAEQDKHSQSCANAQSPISHNFPELLNAELVCLCLQLTSMAYSVVVPEAFGNDLAGRALDHIKDVAADWLDDVSRFCTKNNVANTALHKPARPLPHNFLQACRSA